MSRSIMYQVEGDLQGTIADKLLDKALREGLIHTFDVARQVTWFEGQPGPALRELKKRIEALR